MDDRSTKHLLMWHQCNSWHEHIHKKVLKYALKEQLTFISKFQDYYKYTHTGCKWYQYMNMIKHILNNPV